MHDDLVEVEWDTSDSSIETRWVLEYNFFLKCNIVLFLGVPTYLY